MLTERCPGKCCGGPTGPGLRSCSDLLPLIWIVLVHPSLYVSVCTAVDTVSLSGVSDVVFFPAYLSGRWAWSGVVPLCPLRSLQKLFVHRRRDAARRKLPTAENHREGKFCKSEAGSTRPDGARGETGRGVRRG